MAYVFFLHAAPTTNYIAFTNKTERCLSFAVILKLLSSLLEIAEEVEILRRKTQHNLVGFVEVCVHSRVRCVGEKNASEIRNYFDRSLVMIGSSSFFYISAQVENLTANVDLSLCREKCD